MAMHLDYTVHHRARSLILRVKVNPMNLYKGEKDQKELFNSVVKPYDEFHNSSASIKYREVIYSDVFNFSDKKNMKILDALCGGGANSTLFSQNGNEVTGIDISEEQCLLYQARHPQNKIVCASLFDADLPENYFDLIFIDSLHHLHPRVDEAMSLFQKLLKPNGVLILWEPNKRSIFNLARTVWYKLDHKYFAENEAAIDLKQLLRSNRGFSLVAQSSGGNIAYFCIFLLYPFRIPFRYIQKFLPLNFFIKIESYLNQVQPSVLSFWILAALKKNS